MWLNLRDRCAGTKKGVSLLLWGCRWSEYARDGAPWNTDEEEWLFGHFSAGSELLWLSTQLARTPSAVRARIKQRRNHPLLPPLVVQSAPYPRPAQRAVRIAVAQPCTSSSQSPAPTTNVAAPKHSPASTAEVRPTVVEQVTSRLLKCSLSSSRHDGAAVLLSLPKLRALAARTDRQLTRALTECDSSRHALEATALAALGALMPAEGEAAAADVTVIRVPAQQLVDAVASAAAAYFDSMRRTTEEARRREAKLEGALAHWTDAFQTARAAAVARAAQARQQHATSSVAAAKALGHGGSLLEPPTNLSSLPDADLRAFLLAAGAAPVEGNDGRAALLDAATACARAWEVHRLQQCLTLPEPQRFAAALRLSPGATEEGSAVVERHARSAARRLSLLTHPDKTTADGCAEAFVLVQQALQHFTSE